MRSISQWLRARSNSPKRVPLTPRVPSGRRGRLFVVMTGASLAGLATFMIASAGATLVGSSFDTSNGSLTDTTLHDWNPPGVPTGNVGPLQSIDCGTAAQIPYAGVNCGTDLVKSTSDNAFGQGSKEDTPSPTVVFGSIPPNKDDLSRFYVNTEQTATSGNFLYMAWERSNLLGSAHMDFEFNQSQTPSANGVTPVRTAGDVLITFDFGGSGVPDLGLDRWVTTGSTSQCVASNSLPCWGNHVDLSASGLAEGSVNAAPVTDNNPPNNPTTLNGTSSGSTFGEAAVNLSSIFPTGQCENFGSAYLKSRSSGSSFTSELKDFIAPIPVHLSNCGEIKIIKHTDPRGKDQNFTYSTNVPSGSAAGAATFSKPPDSTGSTTTFTLNDSSGTDGSTNTEDITDVQPGTNYTVTEGAEPTGYVLESLTCTAGGSQNTTTPAEADISVTAGSVVTCTYQNQLQLGAIKITKTSSKAALTPLAGATFSITGPNSYSKSVTTAGTGGTVCVGNLPFGTYSVTETAAPTGYSIDDTTAHNVVVSANSTCGDGNEATFSATDTPLTDLTITATSEVSGGTKSSIQCTKGDPAGFPGTDIGNSPVGITTMVDPANVTANGLMPGDYTCKVVIDP
jgi:hypothetical protein